MSSTEAQEQISSVNKTLPLIAWGSCLIGFWPVGLAVAYIDRGKATDLVASHYRYLIRTLWIGLLYGLICFVLSFALVGLFGFFVMSIWYLIRCVKGLVFLLRDQSIPNPGSWLI